MAKSFTGFIDIATKLTLTDPDVDFGSSTYNASKSYPNRFTNGNGAKQANMCFADTRTVAASNSEDLDLAGGLTSALGDTITFTSVKGIVIHAHASNTNDVEIGGDSAAFASFFGDASDTIVLKPGCTFAITNPNANGYAVTASTGDILQIANSSSGTSVSYDILIIGEI